MSMYENGVCVLRMSLLHVQCCVPVGWPTDRINKEVNAVVPTGIESPWQYEKSAGRTTCEELPGRVHVIMVC